MAYTTTIEEEKKQIASRYKDMLKDTYQTLSNEDKLLIRKAFDIAADAHKEQRRKTGEPYIYHPIAVAKIVANEIGLGAYSIASDCNICNQLREVGLIPKLRVVSLIARSTPAFAGVSKLHPNSKPQRPVRPHLDS